MPKPFVTYESQSEIVRQAYPEDRRLHAAVCHCENFLLEHHHAVATLSAENAELLPALAPGVLVHFHDVHYPFEYPKQWVYQGRAWNEAYLLRAFLQYNDRFTVKIWNQFLGLIHRERLERAMPLCMKNFGGSIWLQKQ